MHLSLTLLPMGYCRCGDSVLRPHNPSGLRVELPIWSYLVRAGNDLILIDTGLPRSCLTDPTGLFGIPRDKAEEAPILPRMAPEHTLTAALGRVGVQLADVDLVVNSHLHFDHAGQNDALVGKTVLLHEAEKAGAEGAMARHYGPWWRIPGLSYQTFRGDRELAPGFYALETPGHSPGHLSFLLRLPRRGPLLLAIDAVYTRWNWENGPGAMADEVTGLRSVERLKLLQQEETAEIFFGHDVEQGAAFPQLVAIA